MNLKVCGLVLGACIAVSSVVFYAVVATGMLTRPDTVTVAGHDKWNDWVDQYSSDVGLAGKDYGVQSVVTVSAKKAAEGYLGVAEFGNLCLVSIAKDRDAPSELFAVEVFDRFDDQVPKSASGLRQEEIKYLVWQQAKYCYSQPI